MTVGHLIFAVALAAVPVGSYAQPIHQLLKEGPDARTARQKGWNYAGCLSKVFPRVATKLVALPADSEEFRKVYNSVINSSCAYYLNGTSLPSQVLRGYLFEFNRSPMRPELAETLSTRKPIDYFAEYNGTFGADSKAQIALAQFGDCVVRANPLRAVSLLKGQPASSLENAAFVALFPSLGACVPTGQRIVFSRSALRSAVARGIYELSKAPSTEGSSPNAKTGNPGDA